MWWRRISRYDHLEQNRHLACRPGGEHVVAVANGSASGAWSPTLVRPGAASTAIKHIVTGVVRGGNVVANGPWAAYLAFDGYPGVAAAITTSDAVRMPFAVRL